MDKEKQIEEMFNDIVEITDSEYFYDNKGHARVNFVDLDKLAEKLSEKYQPKITDNEIVISKEEYERLKSQRYIITPKRLKSVEVVNLSFIPLQESEIKPIPSEETIRKETAKEILEELMKNIEFTFGLDGKAINKLNADFVLNMCKKYGVEIGE